MIYVAFFSLPTFTLCFSLFVISNQTQNLEKKKEEEDSFPLPLPQLPVCVCVGGGVRSKENTVKNELN